MYGIGISSLDGDSDPRSDNPVKQRPVIKPLGDQFLEVLYMLWSSLRKHLDHYVA
jgi:hypothetical protein